MRITIEKSALMTSLGHVQSVVERRNTIPILSNVQIEAEDGAVRLTATDLDIAIVERVDADIQAAGATTAPALTLFDIVRKLPDGAQIELALDQDRGRLKLHAGRSDFALSCLPREDFPVMADDEMPHRFQVSGPELRRMIDKSRFAISTEETRYYLNGIYLHAISGEAGPLLRAVATDGHRLARVEMPCPNGAEAMPGVIVPRKAVLELRKLIDGTSGEVEIGVSETRIRFAFDHVVLTSKLIDGTFPDYERVIPSDNDKDLDVDPKVLSQAVDRVSTISPEKSRAVKLSLDKDRIILSANSPEQGSATEELSADYAAEAMEIGFNARYLLDITDRIDGDKIRFRVSDPTSPTIVRDGADDGALYVLMPMRV